jgi:hypothetical protein
MVIDRQSINNAVQPRADIARTEKEVRGLRFELRDSCETRPSIWRR